jgi:hypothetical protein
VSIPVPTGIRVEVLGPFGIEYLTQPEKPVVTKKLVDKPWRLQEVFDTSYSEEVGSRLTMNESQKTDKYLT